MDYTLLLTVGIIFVSTLVGSFLRGRSRDRCIADFDGFMVTLITKTQQYIWGVMDLESTGFELRYASDHVDDQESHIETSYILYKAEFAKLESLHRNIDRLTAKNRQDRDRAARRAFHPNLLSQVARSLRNFTNTAAGSLNEITSLLVGQSKLVTSQAVMTQGKAHLESMTKEVIGYVGTTYDPLLEQLIGIRVVFEIAEEGVWREYVGILKEYSADFLLLLDVYHRETLALVLAPQTGKDELTTVPTVVSDRAEAVKVTWQDNHIRVENLRDRPLIIRSLSCGELIQHVRVLVGPQGIWEQTLDQEITNWTVNVEMVRYCDVILPRAHAIVRHRAERYDHAEVLKLTLPQLRQVSEQGELRPETQEREDCDRALAHWLYLAGYESVESANAHLDTACLKQSSTEDKGQAHTT